MVTEYILPRPINRRIGKAMHDYSMLEDGDKVLVAVSGGVDSLVLTWILNSWMSKAPIEYTLTPINVDNGFWTKESGVPETSGRISKEVAKSGLKLRVEKGREVQGERSCFFCAKQRRNQLFEIAREEGFTKIALGHHKDDLVETFFLNILYSGNISTMMPKQSLFEGTLNLIRPMAYLEKHEVRNIAEQVGLLPIDNLCPLADHTRRERVREILQSIYEKDPSAKSSIFASLGNVREGYML